MPNPYIRVSSIGPSNRHRISMEEYIEMPEREEQRIDREIMVDYPLSLRKKIEQQQKTKMKKIIW